MLHNAKYRGIWRLAFLQCIVTVASLYAQQPSPALMQAEVAGVPTASTIAYPQSVYVDSRNGNIWVTDFDNNRVLRYDASTLSSVSWRRGATRAERYGLRQNYPNPFNSASVVTFALERSGAATVEVYNTLGQRVATLFDGMAAANVLYVLTFNGARCSSGVYFCVLRSARTHEFSRMVLLR